MKTLLVLALLASSALATVPTAAAGMLAGACNGNPDRVALCQSGCCGRDCYDVYALGDSVYGFCIAPDAVAATFCHGDPERVAVCESWGPGYNCFDVYVLGEGVLHPCIA